VFFTNLAELPSSHKRGYYTKFAGYSKPMYTTDAIVIDYFKIIISKLKEDLKYLLLPWNFTDPKRHLEDEFHQNLNKLNRIVVYCSLTKACSLS
jgi:hypothetical protein